MGYHGHFYSEDLWNTLCCMVGSSMAKSVCWGVQDGMICPSTETPSWAKAATHTRLALHVLYWTMPATSCNMVSTSKIQMGNHTGRCCSRRKGWGMSCWYPEASMHSPVWNRPSYPGASKRNTYFNLSAQGWDIFFSLAYRKYRHCCYWYECPIKNNP